MSDNQLLRLEKINKYFTGVHALKDIDFQLNKGEVHCLAGENGSGKSTLVKITAGVYEASSGKIIINNHEYTKLSPQQAMDEGIQVIYQDLSLFEHLTIAENIAINKMKQLKGFVSKKKIRQIAQEQLAKIGVELDLEATVRESSMGNRQITAICRALAMDAKILFMDEPTTALTKQEVDKLLEIVLDLKSQGLSIVFISHKLDEVLKVSDRITVFRDGDFIGSFDSKEMNQKKLSYYMTGRDILYPKYHNNYEDKSSLLVVENLKGNKFSDISLEMNKGDILGLIGLLGSGRTEFALSLFGLNPATKGHIFINGKEVTISNAQDAKNLNIALLPEDRGTQGLFLDKTVCENITSAIVNDLTDSKNHLFAWEKEREIAKESVKKLNVKTPDIATNIGDLSGGNQQKAVIAKWILTHPQIFIMDSPTVGIDIGSKAEIYQIVQDLARKGVGIILISDEVEEIMTNANKVAIFSKGKVVKILNDKDLEQEGIEKRLNNLVSTGGKENNEK